MAVIEGPSGRAEVDARPSDALNAALIAGARVTVRQEVLDLGHDHSEQTLADLTEKFPLAAADMVADRPPPAVVPPEKP